MIRSVHQKHRPEWMQLRRDSLSVGSARGGVFFWLSAPRRRSKHINKLSVRTCLCYDVWNAAEGCNKLMYCILLRQITRLAARFVYQGWVVAAAPGFAACMSSPRSPLPSRLSPAVTITKKVEILTQHFYQWALKVLAGIFLKFEVSRANCSNPCFQPLC